MAVTRVNPNSIGFKEKIMKTNGMKWFFVGAFTVAASLSALAVVNIPNSFTAGQPIKAADVNANFSSLKSFVDTLEGTVTTHNHAGQAWTSTAGIVLQATTETGLAALYGNNTGNTSGSGVEGHANGALAAGVYGINPNGPGVWGSATGATGIGVYGKGGNYGGFFESDSGSGLRIKTNTVGHNLIYALGPGDNNSEFLVDDQGNGAFRGTVNGASGKFNSTSSAALDADSTLSTAIIATSHGSGVTALIVNQRGDGNIIIGRDAANAEVFRVNNNGNVQVQGVSLTSDRNAKKNFSSVNSQSILEKVAHVPISSWNYKTDANNLRHIGPMAQDFHATFGLNGKDDKHISSVDEAGVALAAIQGLYQQNQFLIAQLKTLEARLAKLERK
jgi:Chaperone of endosialidase